MPVRPSVRAEFVPKVSTSLKPTENALASREQRETAVRQTVAGSVAPASVGGVPAGSMAVARNVQAASVKPPAIPNQTLPSFGESQLTRDRPAQTVPATVATASPTHETALASTTATDTVAAAVASISPDPTSVKFSLWRFPVWKGTSADMLRSVASGGIADKTIPVGRYLFTFDLGAQSNMNSWAIAKEFPFTASGKRMIFKRGQFDASTGLCRVEVEVVENLIPLLLVAAACLTATGFAGFGISSALTQVDKIVDDTWKIVGIIALGAVAYFWLWPKLKKGGS
jgi:hypothetical protein